jgi:hypothetical protein
MTAWRGIVGRSFTPDAFEKYVASLKFNLWRPRFIVVHNTSAPDLKTWHGWQARKPPVTDEKWAQNLVGYYRDQQHWSAGPHLFVTPRGILAFSPLTGPGTHSPAWKSISWGVETVGEFEHEPFEGPVRDNLFATLAILHSAAGLQPEPYERGVRGLHFHKEDPVTTHKSCPGKNMVKAELVAAVEAEILRRHRGGGHAARAFAPVEDEPETQETSEIPETETMPAADPAEEPAPAEHAPSDGPPHGVSSVEIEVVKRRLDALGYHEFGTLDGEWGGKTAAAIAAFKNDRHLRGEPVIDQALREEFDRAEAEGWKRPIAEARANATAKDLKERVPAVRQSLRQMLGAKITALGSAGAAAFTGISANFQAASDKLAPVKDFFAQVPAWAWLVLAAGLAGALWYAAEQATAANVKDFNEGKRV